MQFDIGHNSDLIFEPVQTKPTIWGATSENSDKPAHMRSLIRVFADRIRLLQPPSYSKKDKQEALLHWVDGQTDLSLFWSHRSYCRFCRALILFSNHSTVSPLYTDTRLNDKIRHNDNLNVTKPSLKRWRLMRNYARILHLNFKLVLYLLESPHWGDSN